MSHTELYYLSEKENMFTVINNLTKKDLIACKPTQARNIFYSLQQQKEKRDKMDLPRPSDYFQHLKDLKQEAQKQGAQKYESWDKMVATLPDPNDTNQGTLWIDIDLLSKENHPAVNAFIKEHVDNASTIILFSRGNTYAEFEFEKSILGALPEEKNFIVIVAADLDNINIADADLANINIADQIIKNGGFTTVLVEGANPAPLFMAWKKPVSEKKEEPHYWDYFIAALKQNFGANITSVRNCFLLTTLAFLTISLVPTLSLGWLAALKFTALGSAVWGTIMGITALMDDYSEKKWNKKNNYQEPSFTDYPLESIAEWYAQSWRNKVQLYAGITLFVIAAILLICAFPSIDIFANTTLAPLSQGINAAIDFFGQGFGEAFKDLLSPLGESITAVIFLEIILLTAYDSLCRFVKWVAPIEDTDNSQGKDQEDSKLIDTRPEANKAQRGKNHDQTDVSFLNPQNTVLTSYNASQDDGTGVRLDLSDDEEDNDKRSDDEEDNDKRDENFFSRRFSEKT